MLGVLLAIGITTVMDAGGLTLFSALPLFPLLLIFWFLGRYPRQEVGFVRGSIRHYGLALFYPLVVLGAIILISVLMGVVDTSDTNWDTAVLNLGIITFSTVLVVILTEEGFFRGWLWASLRESGSTRGRTLLWTSAAFSLWHLSAATLTSEFRLPVGQVPIYLLNAALLGAIWGLLRSISGSVIVASVSHGLWNGLAYTLFGFGTTIGALGIQESFWFGPEVGILGLVLNSLFLFGLWRQVQERAELNSINSSDN